MIKNTNSPDYHQTKRLVFLHSMGIDITLPYGEIIDRFLGFFDIDEQRTNTTKYNYEISSSVRRYNKKGQKVFILIHYDSHVDMVASEEFNMLSNSFIERYGSSTGLSYEKIIYLAIQILERKGIFFDKIYGQNIASDV